MNKLSVTILAGGSSVEREVSLKSARNLMENLSEEKYHVTITELPANKRDTAWVKDIIQNKPHIVFSALHGGNGENGSVQGLLHCLDIPYIGSRVLSSAICMNKQITKALLKANHIQVPDHIFIQRDTDFSLYEEQIKMLGFPLIIKPNRGGSSIGIAVVNNIDEAKSAVDKIVKEYYDDILAEKYLEGRETSIFVIQAPDSLSVTPVLDITKAGKYFDYNDKYNSLKPLTSESSLPEFMQGMIADMAKKAFKVLNCSGYCCVDMIVKDEQVYIIEVNTLPGLTKNSLLPQAVKALGINFSDFLDKMIEFELNR